MTAPDQNAEVRQPTSGELRAVIIRADGTREDIGLIAAHYRNPFKRAWWLLLGKPLADRRIRRANDRHAKQAVEG